MTLDDGAARAGVLVRMHDAMTAEDLPLLREVLAREVEARRAHGGDDPHYENLYWAAFLLARAGALEDVLPMWRAKHVDFDCGCGFDVQFLVGAGVDATLAYLDESDDGDAAAAAAYIRRCREGGDFDDLATWAAYRDGYFRG